MFGTATLRLAQSPEASFAWAHATRLADGAETPESSSVWRPGIPTSASALALLTCLTHSRCLDDQPSRQRARLRQRLSAGARHTGPWRPTCSHALRQAYRSRGGWSHLLHVARPWRDDAIAQCRREPVGALWKRFALPCCVRYAVAEAPARRNGDHR